MNKQKLELLLNQERFILELLKQNFTKIEIAKILNTSPHTIKSHIVKLEKLGVWHDDFLK